MGIMAACTGKFMPLFRRVWDPVGRMFAMAGSPKERCNDMPAVALARMAAHTQKPDRSVKPARIFGCMRIVAHAAFVRNIRRVIVFFIAPLLFLRHMTFVAQFWYRVFKGIFWLPLGVVTCEATPDETRPVNK